MATKDLFGVRAGLEYLQPKRKKRREANATKERGLPDFQSEYQELTRLPCLEAGSRFFTELSFQSLSRSLSLVELRVLSRPGNICLVECYLHVMYSIRFS